MSRIATRRTGGTPRRAVAVVIAAAGVTALALSGCASPGASAADAASSAPSAAAKPATVTVFAAASLTEAFDTLA